MNDDATRARVGLDTLHTVETPEGVRLQLRAAGPIPRALAYSVDSSVRFSIYTIASLAIVASLGGAGVPLIVLVVFVSEWFYPVLFEVLSNGQTIGKRAVGLRVVNDDGTPIGWSASILRNLLIVADIVPGTFLVALAAMMSTKGFQRVGDLAAGTMVIHASPVAVANAPEADPQTGRAIVALAPPIALSLDEQRAVIAYGERAPLLSDARAEELARVAEPLVASGSPARDQLLRMAAWLSGRGSDSSR